MVGLPGKSKGCLKCRKRKIRCDLNRPECNQCQRTKRICGGYAKPTIFFNKSSQGFDLHSRGTSEITYPVTEHLQDLGQSPTLPQPHLKKRRDDISILVSYPLDATLLSQNIVLAEFVNSTLPKGAMREPPLSWITTILDSADRHETLSLAGSAIGHGWTGHIEGRSDRVTQGRRCYTQAMSCLRKDLAKGPVACPEMMLAITSALALYELIEFGTHDARGWLTHVSGIETIISQASAQAFMAGSSHKVFLFCRVIIILRSLLHRRTTFLRETEWCHVPWTLHPKSSFHQLLDVVSEVATLLEIYDAHEASWTAGICENHKTRNLLIKTALLVSQLRRWHAELTTCLPQGPLNSTENEDNTILFGGPMRRSLNRHWYPARQHSNIKTSFELLQQARLMLFYWTIVLTLQSEVFRSHPLRAELYQAHKISDDTNDGQDIEKDIRVSISIDLALECADNIVKWFEFSAQDAWNSFGPAFGVFSLKAAITWYSIY